MGLCTGLLAAAALSVSQSAVDLVENALNTVRVAFRIGITVNDAAQRLSTDVNQSWSRLVFGVQNEVCHAEIRQFNERKVRLAFSSSTLSRRERPPDRMNWPAEQLAVSGVEP